jgi:leader peptidase (prepilin peptidase) / N-methyltransferase
VCVQVLIAAVAGLVGLVTGSYAGVPIHRWPAGATLTSPLRSACPACGRPVRLRDHVPVLSWLALRGRCRDCGAPIERRYLVVEIATAVLFVRVAWVWWEHPALLLTLLVFTWALVVATAIDLEHRIIPNRLTLRLPLVLLSLLVIVAAMDDAWGALVRGVITGIAIPLVMFVLSELFRLLRGKPGMGMGDVKLALSIGLVVGYLGGLEIVVFAYGTVISAVVIAIGLMLAGRARLATRIPFGPYLAVGCLLVVLAGDPLTELVRSYLGI